LRPIRIGARVAATGVDAGQKNTNITILRHRDQDGVRC
jgi:hypothetical protein